PGQGGGARGNARGGPQDGGSGPKREASPGTSVSVARGAPARSPPAQPPAAAFRGRPSFSAASPGPPAAARGEERRAECQGSDVLGRQRGPSGTAMPLIGIDGALQPVPPRRGAGTSFAQRGVGPRVQAPPDIDRDRARPRGHSGLEDRPRIARPGA